MNNIEKFIKNNFAGLYSIDTINSGANNQGYKVATDSGMYFIKAFDPQQKLSPYKQLNEFSFSKLIYPYTNNIAKPILMDESTYISAYEYIDGTPIPICEDRHIIAVIKFLKDINIQDKMSFDPVFRAASDAVNSLSDFVKIVDDRLNRFKQLNANTELTELCVDHVINIKQRFNSAKQKITVDWKTKWALPLNDSILSPSDFGFHNALETDEQIYFLDFEYAGLDSPWKLISDFFSQPQVPVSLEYIPQFVKIEQFAFLSTRADEFLIVFELTQLKWCLIMLNEFLPDIQKRRVFSWNNSCKKVDLVQQTQLAKSKHYLNNISANINALKNTLQR